MARAKQTRRAEARRQYRQASHELEAEGLEEALDEPAPATSKSERQAGPRAPREAKPAPAPPRSGIGYAFRAAYHPANVPADLRALPQLVRHWSLWLPIGLIAAGAVISTIWWNYTGGQLAWQVLVYPGSGFGLPQLLAGFFALRASYLLGFIVSVVQGIAATLFVLNLSAQLGSPLTEDQLPALLTQAFIAGPLSGTLFASAAAWYRRFLQLSSPRRAAAARAKAKAGSGGKR